MTPLVAEDVAECIVFAATRPPHVNIDELVVKPRDQAHSTAVHRHDYVTGRWRGGAGGPGAPPGGRLRARGVRTEAGRSRPPPAYDEYCARCHGDDGRGDPKMVRLKPKLDLVRSEMVLEGDLDLVRERIAEGRGDDAGLRGEADAGGDRSA